MSNFIKKWCLLALSVLLPAAVMARTVYVTRHGQVGDKKYSDRAVREIKLTPLGVDQAQTLANYLVKDKGFKGTVLVSPLYRTIETGCITANLLNRKVILEPGIQEVARGNSPRGMTLAEINARFPGKTTPGSTFIDDWRLKFENDTARQQRVSAALDRILSEYQGDLLLVCHGGIVGNLVRAFEAKYQPKVPRVRGKAWNCCLYTFELDDHNRVIRSSYTTEYLPDEKITSNFRRPKVPKPDDLRYDVRTSGGKIVRKPGERLVLITRHCQQTGGAKHPTYIRPVPDDAGISPLGIQQAKRLGVELQKMKFKGKIYTSPYFRCVATGSYAAEICGSKVYPDARIQQRSRRKGGNLKKGGATLARFRQLFPAAIAPDAVLADNWLIQVAETSLDQRNRTKNALLQILAENPGQDILIVSHGSAVPEYCFNLIGKKPKDFVWNCALFRFAVNEKGEVRYLGYDIGFMEENEVTSNLKHSLLKQKAGVKAAEKSGVDYEF